MTLPEPAPGPADGHALAMGLRAAYLTMHRRANAEFARFGLTADQFVVLTALAEADGVTQKELVRRTDSDPNTTSEMLGRLERLGLVSRERDGDDGRARRVSLTDLGRDTQSTLWRESAAFREKLEGLFSPDDLHRLIHGLGRIARAVPEFDGPA